ncbi:ABC transporter ATP-binding protein [Chelatococcus asaccharovorans]|uniref:ABC transporter ATP-binding protein n=1 Tax=Chelatococcus asaccharovorans TaxID=28210 RepID=UPI00224C7452|nr:oligopeptide/dipeptide ABC transporter ATP-binding protein [Chelatococcus asaccharovorans]CAH1655432.1 dipeptide ABC transporter ATP binding subunit DppF [Chelatococcus asaccharovorans]CAH1685427.1 dipeptide ABC transporter ATP binding subunit DppF [Chelatococcus asaccharovorans]
MTPLLSVRDLVKHYPTADGGRLLALDGISFDLAEGEILGIVGESGCGKSTLGRSIMRLDTPTGGEIWYGGRDLAKISGRDLKQSRAEIQMIFQDPFGSLNPRHSVATIIGEPLAVHGRPDRAERVRQLLDLVGLPQSAAKRLPHQFSGGQRQRIAIARALAINPRIIVADEAVSALDVSIQSQIINLLAELRREFGLSIIFISHDLSVVRHISDRIAVMYFGRIVEQGPAGRVFENPKHPYTRALLSAVPGIPGKTNGANGKRERIVLTGDVPNIARRPGGCLFHPRCFEMRERCRTDSPELRLIDGDATTARLCACHYAEPA